MPRAIFAILVGLPLLAGCVEFPDLDAAIAQRGPVGGFPELIPIDPLLLEAEIDTLDAQAQAELLVARVSQLRARARALQRPVIDRATRAKMAAAVRRIGS